MDLETLAGELDDRHNAARIAYQQRDLEAYRTLFSPELAYRQPKGVTISRDALMKDVAAQFRRLSRVDSTYAREALDGSDDTATEVLAQTASLEAVAFGVVRRRWVLNRHATYHWTRIDGAWLVRRVEVSREAVTQAGWAFGLDRSPQ